MEVRLCVGLQVCVCGGARVQGSGQDRDIASLAIFGRLEMRS